MGGARARCPTLRDSKTRGKWTFTRARGELCANRPQVVQGTCAPTGAARLCPPDALRVIRGRSSGSGETRATELPKPSAAVFAQVRLATNCTPARASLRDSLSLGGYALGFPPWAGVSPSPCAAHLHPCSHRPWRLTSFGGYAPSAFVVEFELWLSSGWVGSHRVAYSRLESGGQADYDKYAADLPRSLGSG